MDALKLEAFKVALFILPGIVTLRIRSALSISSSKPLNTVVDGLVFTLLDHAVFGIVRVVTANFPDYSFIGRLKALGNAIAAPPGLPGELGRAFVDAGGFPIIIVAVVLGVGLGAVRYHGWDFGLLRTLRLTNRTGENLVWAETLTRASDESFAVVACRDGSRFLGRVDTFSEEAENYEILLGDASQVQADGTLLPILGDGVLLTRENPIVRVELWNARVGDSVAAQGGMAGA